MKKVENPDWYKTILQTPTDTFQWRAGILVDTRLRSTEETIWRQSTFKDRSENTYTTSWCEQQLGEMELNKAFDMTIINHNEIVMDLGCGDGRYVRYLLNRGFTKIVALNYELEPLIQLANSLTPNEKQHVLLICADIFEHPLQLRKAKFVLAWGLMTSTLDFHRSLNVCIDLLTESGWLFNAEPVLEQALVYALVKADLKEFHRILITKTRPRMWNEREKRYRVLTSKELMEGMISPRLKSLKIGGINTLPSLVFGGLLDSEPLLPAGVTLESLWREISDVCLGWNRQITFLSQKITPQC